MNAAEMRLFAEVLHAEIVETQGHLMKLKDYVSEVPAPCDKCDGPENYCFKCEGTGIVKNKHLCSWPWD